MTYTMAELMVAVAARDIQDGEVVFVGMRLPLLAFLLSKETHAPHAVGIFENGVLRDSPSRDPLHTMSDPPNILGATMCTDMLTIMGLLQRGLVNLGFIGGAEIDRYGNLNTTYIGGLDHLQVRLPGSGGACDIACLSQRLLVIMPHEKRRFRPSIDYVTSPGFGRGGDWRRQAGIGRGGPAAVITTKGVLRFDRDSGEAYLASHHPGVSVEEILAETGWPLRVAPDLSQTDPPTPQELALIRRFDPHGFWTGAREG